MSDSTKYRDYRGTKGQIDDADPKPKAKAKSSPPPKKRGVNADDARKSKRTEDGNPTYGPPMQGSAFDNQSTDSNN